MVRILLAARDAGAPLSTERVDTLRGEEELAAGRMPDGLETTALILRELSAEGFCMEVEAGWRIGASV